MIFPKKVYTQGEEIKVVRRKPTSGLWSWHLKAREVHVSGSMPNALAAQTALFTSVLTAVADLQGIDITRADLRVLGGAATDTMVAEMEAQE